MLELYDLPKLGFGVDSLHLIAETFKFAFANRMGLGDPQFVANVSKLVPIMLNKQHAELLTQKISMV